MEHMASTVANDIQTTTQKRMIFSVKLISSHLLQCTITVDAQTTSTIRKRIVKLFTTQVKAPGLKKIPTTYINLNYQQNIEKQTKRFIYNFFVTDFFQNKIINEKIPIANHPRLTRTELLPSGELIFSFNVSIADPINIREWKHFVFKAPKRKNYKDLDKQVAHFMKQQQEAAKKQPTDIIQENDWVGFSAQLCDEHQQKLIPQHVNHFWLRIAPGTIRHPITHTLLNKKKGDSFQTTHLSLETNLHETTHDQHPFFITITGLAKGNFFSFDLFKSNFKLYNKSAIHEKLIEVFSFRNDISQRRTIIEEMFHLLFSKHRFEIPNHLILRKQEEIVLSARKRPDYHAYRSQENFNHNVTMLAEKQLKEEILIDQIVSHEKIKVETKDIVTYLNLLNNPRTKEFLYFRSFLDHADDYPAPIHESILKQICRREKTLNYILYHLMR